MEKQQAIEDRRRQTEQKLEEERQRVAAYVKELEGAKQVGRTFVNFAAVDAQCINLVDLIVLSIYTCTKRVSVSIVLFWRTYTVMYFHFLD